MDVAEALDTLQGYIEDDYTSATDALKALNFLKTVEWIQRLSPEGDK